MTSSYFQSLDQAAQARYREKLFYGGQVLPDPFDEDVHVRGNLFSKQHNFWPPVSFLDVHQFLVESEGSYSPEEFRNFKTLPCYIFVQSNKVHDIKCYHNLKLQICVLACIVQETDSVFELSWVSTTMSGEVLNGHCTCMEGLSEACSHVAALLFTLEIASREGIDGIPSVSLGREQKKTSKRTSRKAPAAEEKERIGKRHCVMRQFSGGQLPSAEAYATFLRIIKKHFPQAPVLACVNSDDETSSEGEDSIEEIGRIERAYPM